MIITLKDNHIDMSLFNKYYKDTQKRQGFLTIQEMDTPLVKRKHKWYNFQTKKLTSNDECSAIEIKTSTDNVINLDLPKGKYVAKFNIVGVCFRSIIIEKE